MHVERVGGFTPPFVIFSIKEFTSTVYRLILNKVLRKNFNFIKSYYIPTLPAGGLEALESGTHLVVEILVARREKVHFLVPAD